MKKELIVVHQWHSGIGEQIIVLHFFLNLIVYIKDIDPNCTITYRFVFNNRECSEDVVKFGINFKTIRRYVDKIETCPTEHSFYLKKELENEEYEQVFTKEDELLRGMFGQSLYFDQLIFIKKYTADEHFKKLIKSHVDKLKILPQFNITANSIRRSETTKIIMFDVLSDDVKRIASRYIRKQRLKKFTTLHLRQDPPFCNRIGVYSSSDDKFFTSTIKSKFDSYITNNKKYFLSSNSEDIKKAYNLDSNVCFINRNNRVASKLRFVEKINTEKLSDAFAFIELGILMKSKHIIHSMDCRRDIISLFIWYPAYYSKISITWLGCHGGSNVITFDEYGCNSFR